MEEKKIGIIGTGIMGEPISKNLLENNFKVNLFNRTKEKLNTFENYTNANIKDSANSLAEESDIIITILSDEIAVKSIIDNMKDSLKDKIIINMSTVSPKFTETLSKKIDYYRGELVDAPISGSRKPAEEGNIVILAGGYKETINELSYIFDSISKKTVYCGLQGKGSMMKMSINLLLATCMEGLAEMITYGEKGGLDPETMLDTVFSGPLNCGLFQLKKEMFSENEYPVQFPLKHMSKDLSLITQTGNDIGKRLPVGEELYKLYNEALEKGYGENDFASITEILKNK